MVYNQLVTVVFLAAMIVTCQAWFQQLNCHTPRLPQDTPWHCRGLRNGGLHVNSFQFPLSRPTQEMPYARLQKNGPQFLAQLAVTPFLAEHSTLWIGQGVAVVAAKSAYLLANGLNGQDMTMEDYKIIKDFFRGSISSPFNLLRGFMKYPSASEPFQSDFTKWISDKYFAEQRLAGINPLTIQKITLSNEIGMNYNSLKELLNPKFNWINAVNKVLGQVTDEESLKKAMNEGYLFVLYHPLSKDIQSMPDRTDSDPKRHMWEYKSPIAIFASRRDNAALMPVAIQMDAERDASVYTPQDGDNWRLAKLNVHQADLSCSQVVEHLSKVHFTIEAVCLSFERKISVFHPLYDMMKFHCRGIFVANTLGGPVLLEDNNDLDHVLEFGNEGANILTKRAAEFINWHDLDLKNNLKRRGVDDKTRLPYYPYRDDGLVIHDVLKSMMTDYVNAFYSSNSRVASDYEVQNFAKEISKNAHGGSIRGFPASIKSKDSLIETFTRILWVMVGHHTAINYPQSDYANYIPNISTKLYDVVGVANDTFTAARLENRNAAAAQLGLVSSLSSFRMDRLFDYGNKLGTSQGKKIVHYYKHKLDTDIQPALAKRNRDRLHQGHLTYPYMQPNWLTNGIQA